MVHSYYLFLIIFVSGILTVADAGSENHQCQTTLVVDKSGYGDFESIQSAIDSVPSGNAKWVCIKVNAGTYKEKVTVPSDKNYILLKGSGMNTTRIVMNDHGHELTDDLATFRVVADHFVARSISFVNEYNVPWNNGNPREIAPAAYLTGDKLSFHHCAFHGLQDTLYDAEGRHYFSNCYISGAVDFILGDAQSIYQNSTIYVVGQALDRGSAGYITAHKRNSSDYPSWFVFKGGKVVGKGKAYLGRPWRPYARVLFYKTYMSNVVVPAGWSPWDSTKSLKNSTAVFSEYQCHGPGANKAKRVSWRAELEDQQVKKLVDKSFIDESNWIENHTHLELVV